MFECQFYTFEDDELDDLEYEPYCWLWDTSNSPDRENPKLEETLNGTDCVAIPLAHIDRGTWGPLDNCDLRVTPNIMIINLDGVVEPGNCTSSGTPWTFTLLAEQGEDYDSCLLYTSPSPRDATLSRMPSSA